jgi:hypothetical protein
MSHEKPHVKPYGPPRFWEGSMAPMIVVAAVIGVVFALGMLLGK